MKIIFIILLEYLFFHSFIYINILNQQYYIYKYSNSLKSPMVVGIEPLYLLSYNLLYIYQLNVFQFIKIIQQLIN